MILVGIMVVLVKALQIKSLTEKFYITAQTRQFFFALLPQTRQLFKKFYRDYAWVGIIVGSD